MSSAKLIPLEAWARARYGDHSPHIKTLRRWAKDAKIVPIPKKEGRRYVVSEHARFIDYNDPNYADAVAEALSEPSSAQHG